MKLSFEDLEEVPEGCIEHELYMIVQDIDTAGDMFKPEITPYFKHIHKLIKKANNLIVSDGYKLYYKEG